MVIIQNMKTNVPMQVIWMKISKSMFQNKFQQQFLNKNNGQYNRNIL